MLPAHSATAATRSGVRSGEAPSTWIWANPDTWSTTQNVAWKTDIPGTGWSSPVVWGDRIFLTSVISADKQETPKKGLYFGGNRLDPPKDEHRWMVYCLDTKTGKILWDREVYRGTPKSSRHLRIVLPRP